MWLAKKIGEIKRDEQSFYGGSAGEYETVASCCVMKDVENVFPFGFYEETAGEKELVFLKGDGRDICIGTTAKPKENLEKGEAIIFNDAGAKILLKNDGSVVINGGLIIYKDGKIHINEGNKV